MKTQNGPEPTKSTQEVDVNSPNSSKIATPENSNCSYPLLVIVGMPGAGKSVVVKYLQCKGWNIVHFGSITMKELVKRNLAVNEAQERKVREELRKTYGMEAYARLSIRDITNELTKGPTVIDGLYSWSEYKFLINQIFTPMYIIAIFTPRHLRYERLLHRSSRPLTLAEAKSRDFAEIECLEKGGPIALADFTIENSSSLENLCSEIDKLLNSLLPNNKADSQKRNTENG